MPTTKIFLRLPLACTVAGLLSLPGCSFSPTAHAPIEERSISRATSPAAAPEEESSATVTLYPEAGNAASATPLSGSEAPRPLAESESPPPSTAVVALLDTATQQTRAGKLDNAAATLERALRLEPRNAELWTRLAEIRLQQGQLDQAAGLAAKSNNLAGNNAGIITRNLKIIEQVRARKGGAIKNPR